MAVVYAGQATMSISFSLWWPMALLYCLLYSRIPNLLATRRSRPLRGDGWIRLGWC
jgi:hypothetical protein